MLVVVVDLENKTVEVVVDCNSRQVVGEDSALDTSCQVVEIDEVQVVIEVDIR